ncbi:hyperosmotically inducible protein [Oxalobacteraceae bacterium GrIS 2.11]
MKNKLATACFISASLLMSVAAIAQEGDSDRTHPLTFIKDSVITTKVKAKLADDKMSSLAHVKVDTDAHGAVVLSGTVRSREQQERAVMLAKGTEGVTSVQDRTTIKKDD